MFNRISKSARTVSEARERALPEAVKAVREMENALQEALDGEPLRGLRNLGGSASFYAARVRAKPDKKLPTPNEAKGERDFLCLDHTGKLVIAWWDDVENNSVELQDRPAGDDDIRIGDVEDMLRALDWALPRHLEASARTARRYENITELSAQVQQLMGDQ